jgi:hypothetical protein
MISFLKRGWIPLVIVVVLAAAGFGVYRLHGIFGSVKNAGNNYASGEIVPFNPKHVVYEVFGAAGTVATVNYLDENAQPQQVASTTLPWSYEITTTLPTVFANVVAQGNSHYIGCRIIVDGEVKQDRSNDGINAQTYCLVKSA